METGEGYTAAKGTNYGAAGLAETTQDPRLAPLPASPVHANVDLPFRPLAAFVPEAHWQRLEQAGVITWRARLGRMMGQTSPLYRWFGGRLGKWGRN